MASKQWLASFTARFRSSCEGSLVEAEPLAAELVLDVSFAAVGVALLTIVLSIDDVRRFVVGVRKGGDDIADQKA